MVLIVTKLITLLTEWMQLEIIGNYYGRRFFSFAYISARITFVKIKPILFSNFCKYSQDLSKKCKNAAHLMETFFHWKCREWWPWGRHEAHRSVVNSVLPTLLSICDLSHVCTFLWIVGERARERGREGVDLDEPHRNRCLKQFDIITRTEMFVRRSHDSLSGASVVTRELQRKAYYGFPRKYWSWRTANIHELTRI